MHITKAKTKASRMETVRGELKKIIFSSKGGFIIGILRLEEGGNLTIKGKIAAAREGLKCVLEGNFVDDPKYGRQFNVLKQTFEHDAYDIESMTQIIESFLFESSRNGNSYLSEGEILALLRSRYDLGKQDLDEIIEFVQDKAPHNDKPQNKIFEDKDLQDDKRDNKNRNIECGFTIEELNGELRFYLRDLYKWEKEASESLKRLNDTAFKNDFSPEDIDFDLIEKRMGITLSEEQKNAVRGAVSYGVTVITGGPGTGKTTILRAIMMVLREMDYFVALAAPTGRAAKRIKESTGYAGQTIHRLLEATVDEKKDKVVFRRNKQTPLDVDAIIVDEASMIDVELMYRLLIACQDGTRLILVGDVNQLPPVGPGSVLRDIIDSEYIHTVILNSIFRQAGLSKIVSAAHQINKGEEPDLKYCDGDNLLFMEKKTYSEVEREIVSLAAYEEAQVITPTKKGELGTVSLNRVLQNSLNPPEEWKGEIQIKPEDPKGDVFRLGDRVMQIKNNYSKEWKIAGLDLEGNGLFNGDMGVICEVDQVMDTISVKFDEEKVSTYERKEFNELQLCYAITVHKSQGSEFSMVVMPISNVGPVLGTKNLLYTGITRGKNNVVLIGSENALRKMVHRNTSHARNSGMKDRLSLYLDE